ncbi:MAG: hypothetical protein H8F28_15390 [Fibrella sp.]|nr:hypothetical protein [Armatimonadota bacterium]
MWYHLRPAGSYQNTAIHGSNSNALKRFLARQLRDLMPGDTIHVNPRLLPSLRGAVTEYLAGGNRSRHDTSFTEAAIYALGILQDEKAHPILSNFSQNDDPRHALYRAILDAMRCINDANATRDALKPTARQSRGAKKP